MRRAPFLLGDFAGYCDILLSMMKVLQEALAEVGRLPASDQESIGRQVLHHVEKLRLLRDDIDVGVQSLDAGHGQELDMDEVISVARRQHEKKGR
jgi:hypothetical protein